MRKAAAAGAAALAMTVPVEAEERRSVAPANMQRIAPALAGYTDEVLFGDVWRRAELSPRDRSLVTLSVLVATGKVAQLGSHLERGLTNGLTPGEIAGMVTHLAFYSGWPNAVSALGEIENVFAARRIDAAALRPSTDRLPVPASEPARAAVVAEQVAPVAPKFAALTNEVLFHDLWRRTDLSARDRSLVTIAALAAGGDAAQLTFHVRRGLENGLTGPQVMEALTQLALYAGWPKAISAVGVAARAIEPAGGEAPAAGVQVFAPGQSRRDGPAQNFTGSVSVASPFKGSGEARVSGATVTFDKSARTNWHTHPLGQLLVVTAGSGWVQSAGEPARAMAPGDVVWIAPGVRHWHGATRSSGVTHVAIAEARDGNSVSWLEPVSENDYQGPT